MKDTVIAPTVVFTVLFAAALIVLTITGPIAIPSEGVWWWGVAAAGTLTGALALPFFWRRAKRTTSGPTPEPQPLRPE